MNIFGIFPAIERAVKFLRVWGKLLLVVGPAIAGFLWSPVFRTFFLGIAVGAGLQFAVQYSEVFTSLPEPNYCVNPNHVPGGPKKQCWMPSDPNDPRDIYGHYEACE